MKVNFTALASSRLKKIHLPYSIKIILSHQGPRKYSRTLTYLLRLFWSTTAKSQTDYLEIFGSKKFAVLGIWKPKYVWTFERLTSWRVTEFLGWNLWPEPSGCLGFRKTLWGFEQIWKEKGMTGLHKTAFRKRKQKSRAFDNIKLVFHNTKYMLQIIRSAFYQSHSQNRLNLVITDQSEARNALTHRNIFTPFRKIIHSQAHRLALKK